MPDLELFVPSPRIHLHRCFSLCLTASQALLTTLTFAPNPEQVPLSPDRFLQVLESVSTHSSLASAVAAVVVLVAVAVVEYQEVRLLSDYSAKGSSFGLPASVIESIFDRVGICVEQMQPTNKYK